VADYKITGLFMAWLINSIDYIIPFLIVLTLLVFVHEMGHYLVARYNKVKIEVFSIGFGPELFGWHDSAGTRWKFSLIPLGGYVRMYGDADPSSRADKDRLNTMKPEDRELTLHAKRLSQRMAVVSAGPIANFLLAIAILTGLFAVVGEPVLTTTIGSIIPGKLADKAGLREGDKILALNGQKATDFYGLRQLIIDNRGKDVAIDYLRNGQKANIALKMVESDTAGHEKPVGVMGIAPSLPEYRRVNPALAMGHAIKTTWVTCRDALAGMGQMIMGKRSSEELGGILSIGNMAGKSAKGGLASLLSFMAFLSINLGLVNLLPIPVLDGGHLLFYIIEGIRGKPVSGKIQEYAFMGGFALVVSIMLMSTWNDVARLILK
jgi:regulator of sigma E protease